MVTWLEPRGMFQDPLYLAEPRMLVAGLADDINADDPIKGFMGKIWRPTELRDTGTLDSTEPRAVDSMFELGLPASLVRENMEGRTALVLSEDGMGWDEESCDTRVLDNGRLKPPAFCMVRCSMFEFNDKRS